jgi:hypothetical protein
VNDETGLSHISSINAAMLGTDAVWIFPVGAIRGNGGIWSDGIPVLLSQ